jgi:hypothetical protein
MMCSALATAGVSFLFDRPFFYTTLRLGFTRGAFSSCSVGFSGVLFAYWSWLSVRDAAAAWRRGPEGGKFECRGEGVGGGVFYVNIFSPTHIFHFTFPPTKKKKKKTVLPWSRCCTRGAR